MSLLLLAVGLPGVGCGRKAPSAAAPDGMRIVCLSPAVTDLLIALQLEDSIVGRDTWEQQLPDDVPRVGDLTNINLEAVIALEPTDVVLQAGRQGTPARLAQIGAERGWNIINLQIDGLNDIHNAVMTLARQLSVEDGELRSLLLQRALNVIESIDASLQPIDDDDQARLGPILLLYGTDPPSAFGPGSYASDVLEALGGHNALDGGAWQELDLETVAAIDPWAVIIVRAGAEPETIEHPQQALGSLAVLDLPCAKAGRVAVLGHARADLPGASVIEVAAELREVLVRLAQPQGSPGQ